MWSVLQEGGRSQGNPRPAAGTAQELSGSLVNRIRFAQGGEEKWQIWGFWGRKIANLDNLSQNLP